MSDQPHSDLKIDGLSAVSVVSRTDETLENGDLGAIFSKQRALENGHEIRYRSCSWQKVQLSFCLRHLVTNAFRLLHYYSASTFVSRSCHFLGAFANEGYSVKQYLTAFRSFSILGMVPGVIVTVAVAAVVRLPGSTQPERALISSDSRYNTRLSSFGVSAWRTPKLETCVISVKSYLGDPSSATTSQLSCSFSITPSFKVFFPIFDSLRFLIVIPLSSPLYRRSLAAEHPVWFGSLYSRV